jgi:DNA adenine methylase
MKWSGSKDSQAKKIISYFPKTINYYFEPFLGGGSVFLELLQSDIEVKQFILSDANKELIDVWNMIKTNPHYLIWAYKQHHKNFNSGDIQQRKDYFQKVRAEFNITRKPEDFYWIMRTTTNGMPRYNKSGEFNNSCHFSRPGMNPDEVEEIILKYSELMYDKRICFYNLSYEFISIGTLNSFFDSDDLVYCDPPYQQTKGMYFGGFNNSKFINWLNNLNCKWLLSYDGKVNNTEVEHTAPKFKKHEYLISGNSSFRRVIGNSTDSIISESLYLNYD